MIATPSFWRRWDDSGVPLLAARAVLAGMFIYMGSAKIQEPFDFLKQLRLYQMLPENPPVFLNASAMIVPWLEIVVGTALLVGLYLRGGAAAAAIMLAVFTPAILIRALAIQAENGISFFDVVFDCGCGGGPVVIWTKLLGNFGLFALAITALASRSRRFCWAT